MVKEGFPKTVGFRMVAFSLSGVLVNFNNSDNAWDLIRNLYKIPNLWKEYLEGRMSRYQVKTEEYKLWKAAGVTLNRLMIDLRKNTMLFPGVEKLFQELRSMKVVPAIVSDSPQIVVEDIANRLGVKYFSSNRILFNKDGFAYETVSSHPSGDGRVSKLMALKDFTNRQNIRLSEVIAVGNDREDIEIFKVAGRSIAFNAKDMETRKAAQIILNSNNLEDLAEYLK